MCPLPSPPVRTHTRVYLPLRVQGDPASEIMTTRGRPLFFGLSSRLRSVCKFFSEFHGDSRLRRYINFYFICRLQRATNRGMGARLVTHRKLCCRGTTSTFRYFTRVQPQALLFVSLSHHFSFSLSFLFSSVLHISNRTRMDFAEVEIG